MSSPPIEIARNAYFDSTVFRAEYPFESRYFDLDGLRYHYLDEGAGEPIVMLHGNPSWSFYYRNLIKALRPEYRCIAPDHIGCGLSQKPDDRHYDYHFEQHVDDLEQLLESLGITNNITLIVHDWGGMIGFDFADRHPERVRRIVILNTAAFHLPSSKGFPWQLALTRTRFGEFLVLRFNAFSAAAARIGCARGKLSTELRRAYTAPYDTPANRIATLRFVQNIPLRPNDRGYQRISAVQGRLEQFRDRPVLIGWGNKDFVFDRHFLAQWRRYLPDARYHVFDDCGHYILEDAAAELIPEIGHFLTENPL